MPRGLGSTITTELARDRIRFSDLLELHFDDGPYNPLCLTNCPLDIGPISTTTATSKTFAANGELLSFDTIEETGEARVNKVSIQLSGASNTITNLFMNNDYVDRRIVIYRYFYDEQFIAIGSPVMLFDGEIQSFSINETEKSSTLTVTSASVFYDFERLNGRRTNSASQQTIFLGDKGFDQAAVVTDKIKWGKP